MNSATVVTSPYLTAREAIVYLRLNSQSALYRLVREHHLPCCLDRIPLNVIRQVCAALNLPPDIFTVSH
jgi:hypothetical protein